MRPPWGSVALSELRRLLPGWSFRSVLPQSFLSSNSNVKHAKPETLVTGFFTKICGNARSTTYANIIALFCHKVNELMLASPLAFC